MSKTALLQRASAALTQAPFVAVEISANGEPDSPFAAAVMSVRMVATDLMIFAGIEPDEATAAVREGIQSQRVPAPPATARPPFSWLRWLRMPFGWKD